MSEQPTLVYKGNLGPPNTLTGTLPTPPVAVPTGRTPRIARLMALAIRFETLVRRGDVRDFAELARLGQVTRARMTQIICLLHLAPDIQAQLLFLAPIVSGRDPIVLRDLQPIASTWDWRKQRKMWDSLRPN
jgi:hypothetical protein